MSDADAKQRAADALAAWVRGRDNRNRSSELVAAYQAIAADKRTLRAMLVTEYRCRAGCLLLHVWQMPTGRYWFTPGYDLSPGITEAETSQAARRKRTTDGYRKWVPQAGSFDDVVDVADRELDSVGITLNCDHVRIFASARRLLADAAVRPGRPRPVLWPTDTPAQSSP